MAKKDLCSRPGGLGHKAWFDLLWQVYKYMYICFFKKGICYTQHTHRMDVKHEFEKWTRDLCLGCSAYLFTVLTFTLSLSNEAVGRSLLSWRMELLSWSGLGMEDRMPKLVGCDTPSAFPTATAPLATTGLHPYAYENQYQWKQTPTSIDKSFQNMTAEPKT